MTPTILTVLAVVISVIFTFIKIVKFFTRIDRNNKAPRIIYRCDGCGKTINGKFIRVTEDNLEQPLDYCSKLCKQRNFNLQNNNFKK